MPQPISDVQCWCCDAPATHVQYQRATWYEAELTTAGEDTIDWETSREISEADEIYDRLFCCDACREELNV